MYDLYQIILAARLLAIKGNYSSTSSSPLPFFNIKQNNDITSTSQGHLSLDITLYVLTSFHWLSAIVDR